MEFLYAPRLDECATAILRPCEPVARLIAAPVVLHLCVHPRGLSFESSLCPQTDSDRLDNILDLWDNIYEFYLVYL